MKVLVTAGNTQTPIDQVRCITNIFSGRTGTRIALEASERNHEVCLLTSHPEVVQELSEGLTPSGPRWRVRPYRTFDDLNELMEDEIVNGSFDAVIHVAAVSDYTIAGTYCLPPETAFDLQTHSFGSADKPARLVDANAGKVKSNHQELWLRLVPTQKIIDRIRKPWGFQGVLVKFKLEVGVTERELKNIAEISRRHSQADVIVANTLEAMDSWALLKSTDGDFVRVSRKELTRQLVLRIETIRNIRFSFSYDTKSTCAEKVQ